MTVHISKWAKSSLYSNNDRRLFLRKETKKLSTFHRQTSNSGKSNNDCGPGPQKTRWAAMISCFFIRRGAQTRSFWAFISGATVKNISSMKNYLQFACSEVVLTAGEGINTWRQKFCKLQRKAVQIEGSLCWKTRFLRFTRYWSDNSKGRRANL